MSHSVISADVAHWHVGQRVCCGSCQPSCKFCIGHLCPRECMGTALSLLQGMGLEIEEEAFCPQAS